MISFINANRDGTARAVLSGCHKFGAATLLMWGGATMTCVAEYGSAAFLSCSCRTRSEGEWGSSARRRCIEVGGDVSNALTSFPKDSMVLEYEED